MFAGTALSVHLFVCAGLSLFIIYGPYLYVVVCVFYAYNLTVWKNSFIEGVLCQKSISYFHPPMCSIRLCTTIFLYTM